MFILKNETVKDIADAIREKENSSELIKPKDMGDKINALNVVSVACIVDANGDVHNDGILGPDGAYYECGAIANAIYDENGYFKRRKERTVVAGQGVILSDGNFSNNIEEFNEAALLYPVNDPSAIRPGIDNYIFYNREGAKEALRGIDDAMAGGSGTPNSIIELLIEIYGEDAVRAAIN